MYCMLCLIETQVGLKVFTEEGKYLQVEEIIRKHFWFVPSEHDELLNSVCYSCWGLVHTFNDFYKKVEDAHKTNTQNLEKPEEALPMVTKVENFEDEADQYEDQMEDSNFMDDEYDDPLNPSTSVSEVELEPPPSKRTRQSSSFRVIKFEEESNNSFEDKNDEYEVSYVKEGSRRRKPQQRRHFVKRHVFASSEEALKYVQNEKTWTKINTHATKIGDKHYYRCKAVKRRSTVKCPANMYLLYSKFDSSVVLYLTKEDHKHDNCDLASQVIQGELKEIIMSLVERGIKCKEILKELEKTQTILPTEGQLRSFLRSLHVQRCEPENISITNLRLFLEQNQTIPDDENQPFISNYYIEENDQTGSFKFFITTKALMNFALNIKSHICLDTNHKLIWQGFPILFVGSTDLENKFHCFGICVSSSEDDSTFTFIFQTLQSTVTQIYYSTYSPGVLLSDPNEDLQTAFVQTFENGKLYLCYESVFKLISKKIDSLKLTKTMKKDIIDDLKILQLSTSDNVFHVGVRLFCEKYNNFQDFIHYFRTFWVVKNSNWYEGYKGYENIPMSNSAMQAFVTEIKRKNLIRERFGLEEFQNCMMNYVRGISEEGFSKYIAMEPNISKTVWLDGQGVANGNDEIIASKKDFDAYYSVHKFNLTDWRCITSARSFADFCTILPQNIIVKISHTNWKMGFCCCDRFYKDFICKHIVGVAIRTGKVDATQFLPKNKASIVH